MLGDSFTGKSVSRNYENWETEEGVMKWLAERGILPCWNSKKKEAYYIGDTPKTATARFTEVLRLYSEDEVKNRSRQLKARSDWQALRAF